MSKPPASPHASARPAGRPIDNALRALRGVKRQGKGWMALCPAHDDHEPSLSIKEGRDGTVVLTCRSHECTYQQIVKAMGISPAELFPRAASLPANGVSGLGKIVVSYPYRDEKGVLIYEVVRRAGKKFSQRRPDGNGRWVWNLDGVQRTLYRLPELLSSDPDAWVFVVEGEKDVDHLRSLGLVATCNSGGAGKWQPEYTKHFRGRRVMIIVDNDEPGRRHAQQVAQALAGLAAEVKVVELPDLPESGDVSDWLDSAGHTVVELLAQAESQPESQALKSSETEAGPQWSPVAAIVGSRTKDVAQEGEVRLLPPPNQPMEVARVLVGDRYAGVHDKLMLRAWRGGWWQWRTTCWTEVDLAVVRAVAYQSTEDAMYAAADKVLPWSPNRHKIADLLEALRAVIHTDISEVPTWIGGGIVPANEIVACANGLLHVPTRRLLPHDPDYFNQVSVPFEYTVNAPAPERWLAFLEELWPGDADSIKALQEFVGYVVSGRTDQHKILLLIGPTRAGKGVIGRVLKALVGRGNHAGPTLASLGTNFGLSPLIGKSLAIVSDARLGSGNVHQVVERLLSISGEDMLTIDIKYKEPWTGTLPTRFLVISNELPRFGDASGAIANRFIVLTMSQSWLGREDTALTDKLLDELPGIFGWALDGLTALASKNRFTEPQSSVDAILALQDLVSPVAAFVRDRCRRGPYEVVVDDIWTAWKVWAEDNGHRPGNKQTFGRDLRAVVPGLRVVRPRDDDRHRVYRGIAITRTDNAPDRGPSRTGAGNEKGGTQWSAVPAIVDSSTKGSVPPADSAESVRAPATQEKLL